MYVTLSAPPEPSLRLPSCKLKGCNLGVNKNMDVRIASLAALQTAWDGGGLALLIKSSCTGEYGYPTRSTLVVTVGS
jgi:hypothetical protein